MPFLLNGKDYIGTTGTGTFADPYILQSTSTTASTAKNEDTAHVDGDSGIMSLAVRKDTAVALAGTDSDYIPLITDAAGRLWVNVGVLTAGETHIGEVGTKTGVVIPSITVDTTPAYSANDVIGGILTLTNAVRVSTGTAGLVNIIVTDHSNQKPIGYIILFNANPTIGTYTNNGGITLSTDDLKVAAIIPIALNDYIVINNRAFAQPNFNLKPVKAASGTSLYAVFVTTSTPQFTATTDFQITFGFLQD